MNLTRIAARASVGPTVLFISRCRDWGSGKLHCLAKTHTARKSENPKLPLPRRAHSEEADPASSPHVPRQVPQGPQDSGLHYTPYPVSARTPRGCPWGERDRLADLPGPPSAGAPGNEPTARQLWPDVGPAGPGSASSEALPCRGSQPSRPQRAHHILRPAACRRFLPALKQLEPAGAFEGGEAGAL